MPEGSAGERHHLFKLRDRRPSAREGAPGLRRRVASSLSAPFVHGLFAKDYADSEVVTRVAARRDRVLADAAAGRATSSFHPGRVMARPRPTARISLAMQEEQRLQRVVADGSARTARTPCAPSAAG